MTYRLSLVVSSWNLVCGVLSQSLIDFYSYRKPCHLITCWQDTYYLPILPPEIKSRAWISMASFVYMYGPSCALQFDSNDFTRRASELSDLPPPLRAHFFYSSALPIDDPLSPVPPPSSSSRTGPSRVPPRPFSIFDNTALEEAWQTIHNPKRHQTASFKLEQTSEEFRNYQATNRAVSNSISTNRFSYRFFAQVASIFVLSLQISGSH